jgi:nucleotide-binding universal stress UspA family protein
MSGTADLLTATDRRSDPAMSSRFDVRAPTELSARILVATDGTPTADGALQVADLLARRDGIPIDVLSVLDPGARIDQGALVEEVERRFATIRGRVCAVMGARPGWRAAIDIGPVGETICRVAGSRASDLIIVGFGQHRRVRDRTPEKATVRQIAEQVTSPVLIVPSGARALPSHGMLALDFSRSSLRAGRAALRVLEPPAVMHLVYVHTTSEPFPSEPTDPDPTYSAGFASFFDAVEHELGAPSGVSFERAVVQHGDPVSELMAYAATNGVQLIAVGNHGKAVHDRLKLGSVSSGLLRSAQCMVLVAGAGELDAKDASPGLRATQHIRGGDE